MYMVLVLNISFMLKFCYKDLYFRIACDILVRGFFHLKKQLLKSIKKPRCAF